MISTDSHDQTLLIDLDLHKGAWKNKKQISAIGVFSGKFHAIG